MNKSDIPDEVICRLFIYARSLDTFKEEGKYNFSSEDIANRLHLKPTLVRKDFSYIGQLGKRGVGYNTREVLKKIKKIAFPGKEKKVALIGVGQLGSALLNYYGFKAQGFKIAAAFDKDEEKIGEIVSEVKVEDIKKFKERIREEKIKIAIIAVPPEEVPGVINLTKDTGIEAVLNFTPSYMLPLDEFSDDFILRNIDLASELARLSYYSMKKSKRFETAKD